MRPDRILKAVAISYGAYLIGAAVFALIFAHQEDHFAMIVGFIAVLPFTSVIQTPIVVLLDAAGIFLAYCCLWTYENNLGGKDRQPLQLLFTIGNRPFKFLVKKLHLQKWSLSGLFFALVLFFFALTTAIPSVIAAVEAGYIKTYAYLNLGHCTVDSLYQMTNKIVATEGYAYVSDYDSYDWWKRCPYSIRNEVLDRLNKDREKAQAVSDAAQAAQEEASSSEQAAEEAAAKQRLMEEQQYQQMIENDPTNCSRYGNSYRVEYNALHEKCECVHGYVLIDGQCQDPPYCGDTATYSKETGACECNQGYRKEGKNCVFVNCTDNSTYDASINKCVCDDGYLLRSGQCKSSIDLCGYLGKYNPSTQQCVECGNGDYLKNGDCVQKPYCGLNSSYDVASGKCFCDTGYLIKNGLCVSKYEYCSFLEEYNEQTGQCDCMHGYIRQNGNCQLDIKF